MGKRTLPTTAMLDGEDEFSELYRLYQPRIYRFLFWRTSDPAAAEDLTSSVFTKAWQARGRFSTGSAQAWLYRIARNTLIDHWRRKQAVPLEAAAEVVDDSAVDVAEQLDVDQAAAELRAAVAQLPADMQRVVELRFMQGLSARQVAERLGLTEGNVRVVQYRALKRIRKILS